jgi:mRNA interferase RelE/StbE
LPVRVEYKASVEKDLRKLSPTAAAGLLQELERPLVSEGQTGESLSGEFAGLYRLRVGDYRVIYVRTDEGYIVLRIGHRREVYRKGRPAAG